jgi:KamA family protein
MIITDILKKRKHPHPYKVKNRKEDIVHLKLVQPEKKPSYLTNYEQVAHIPEIKKGEFIKVCQRYAFRTNSYYFSLINWNDRNDPIRKIIIPDKKELKDWGRLDASHEYLYSKVPGLEHKYTDTAVLLVTDVCGGFCRFCFRKRLFMNGNTEVARDISPGLEYIRKHNEISNILLTGGDPLLLSTHRLAEIIQQIRDIEHVNIIRIGSKLPAFNPFRILNDPTLIEMFMQQSLPHKRIYIMTHFCHPNELTDEACECVDMLIKAGVIVANQTPLLKGVNDNPEVLSTLIKKLSFAGIPPYYIFQGRPTAGNYHFAVPIERAIEIFEKARKNCAGLAKRARLVMSHATGKIEILAKKDGKTYFRYFRAADPDNLGRLLIYKSNPKAYWFDDYSQAIA